MGEKQTRLIVTFHTTAEAMATEQLCRKRDLPGKLISVPRQLTSDCGIAWACPAELRQTVSELLAENGVEYDGLHELP